MTEYNHVIIPTSTLPPEADAIANKHLAASFEQTKLQENGRPVISDERKMRRMQLEIDRARKLRRSVLPEKPARPDRNLHRNKYFAGGGLRRPVGA